MSYKQQVQQDEYIAKLRVVRAVLRDKNCRTVVAKRFSMHRNTVGTLIQLFQERIPLQDQIILLKSTDIGIEDIHMRMAPLKSTPRTPHGNKRCATLQQERLIKTYYTEDNLKVGYKRMHCFVQRRQAASHTSHDQVLSENAILKDLTYAQLKGIFKRNNLRVQKRRTANGNRVPLYDYEALACFERLHYDTKTITDKKALPEAIYNKFKLQKDLPIIEWNIIDVKSRFRFIAYSHERTSEFGFQFLLLVMQFIRSLLLCQEMKIVIGTDNGVEFFSGSQRKQAIWNHHLILLNAEIYSYEPGFDIRKNLIERSHRTDDEEFFHPRGVYINDKKSFLAEAHQYAHYFNNLRPHSGIGMNNKTPIEKLEACGIHNAKRFLEFPTMILEDHIVRIKECTQCIEMKYRLQQALLKSSSHTISQKMIADLKSSFKNFSEGAQNVLTHYHI